MNRIEYEAEYVKAGLEHFKPFLLSPEIFWNIHLSRPAKQAPYPQLSLGNMLLAIHILKSGVKFEDHLELIDSYKGIKREWVRAWQKKAELEFNYRIKQWLRYLADLQGEKNQSKSSFKNDIRIRVLLELLLNQLKDEGQDLAEKLNELDLQFHALMKAAEFVWPSEIKGAFASEDYWFLYLTAKN